MSPELIAIISIAVLLGGVVVRSSWWASGLSSHVENIDTNIRRLVGDVEKMEDQCVIQKARIEDHETRITVLESIR